MEMRPPMNDFDMRVYDAYWALNRAHKGLDVALTSISTAKWKDCQKATLLAEEKVEDAIEIAKSLPAEGKGWMADLLSIRLHASKAAAAPNPERMKRALMEALRLTMETEEVIRRFYEKRAAPHATPHATQLENLKASRKKGPYGVSRKRMRKRSGHKRSGHKRSGHKRSGHKRNKRSYRKRSHRK